MILGLQVRFRSQVAQIAPTCSLDSCSLSPKKQFGRPHKEPVTAKSMHYLVFKTHEQK
jgi:hypothetical protein